MGRAVVERRTVHIHDMAAEREHEFRTGKDLANRFGFRTVLLRRCCGRVSPPEQYLSADPRSCLFPTDTSSCLRLLPIRL
jgi:hypothetical protein